MEDQTLQQIPGLGTVRNYNCVLDCDQVGPVWSTIQQPKRGGLRVVRELGLFPFLFNDCGAQVGHRWQSGPWI